MAYSVDFRLTAPEAVYRGTPIAQVARQFHISPISVNKLRRYCADRGTLELRKSRAPRHRKFAPQDLQAIRRMIEGNAGIAVNVMSQSLSVEVAEFTVWRAIKKVGYTPKRFLDRGRTQSAGDEAEAPQLQSDGPLRRPGSTSPCR